MNLKKYISGVSALAIAASAFAGMAVTANADNEPETVYERGTTTEWSDADLTDWVTSSANASISGGLKLSATNAGFTSTKAISNYINANDLVEISGTIKGGGATGRSGSYDYIKVGGVEFRLNEQDYKFIPAINDVEGAEVTYQNRSRSYPFDIVIDTSKNSVTKFEVNGSDYLTEFTNKTASTLDNIVFGHSKAGKENYQVNPVLETIQIVTTSQTVSKVAYTINYNYENSTIHYVNSEGTIGATVYAESPITIDDQLYYAADGATTSMELGSTASANVLNVNLRLPRDYTVGFETSSLTVSLQQASVKDGETKKLFAPRYLLSGTTLYETAKTSNGNDGYYYEFKNVSAENIRNLTYSPLRSNVVYFSEAEAIEGAASSTSANADIRCSLGTGGYFSNETTVTTLPAGTYKIYATTWGNATKTFSFKAGEEDVFSIETKGYIYDNSSKEFTLTDDTAITVQGGDSSHVLDTVYIVKTGIPGAVTQIGDYTTAENYDVNTKAWKITFDPGDYTFNRVVVSPSIGDSQQFPAPTVSTTGDIYFGIIASGLYYDCTFTAVASYVE